MDTIEPRKSSAAAERKSLCVEQRDLFRAVNERIHRLTRRWPGPVDYVCECDDAHCRTMLTIEPEEFAAIAASPGCHIVAPDHYRADWDIVRNERTYLVVRASHQEPVLTSPEQEEPARDKRRAPGGRAQPVRKPK
jgi:hypothetical protein